jgi:hypothetical protein
MQQAERLKASATSSVKVLLSSPLTIAGGDTGSFAGS